MNGAPAAAAGTGGEISTITVSFVVALPANGGGAPDTEATNPERAPPYLVGQLEGDAAHAAEFTLAS